MVLLLIYSQGYPRNGSQWLNATGWSCYTCKGQTTSDLIAASFYEAAKKNFPDRRIRTDYSDNDPDWEENFYILRHSLCPAVLTENFFMDNLSDLEYLQSRVGKQAVVDTHVEGMWNGWRSIIYIINLYKIIMYDIMSSEETSCIFSICICVT